jgi:hypothetical protein
MQYLENSSGPDLVPPIPDQTRARSGFEEFGLVWANVRPRRASYRQYPYQRALRRYFVEPDVSFDRDQPEAARRLLDEEDFVPASPEERDIHRKSLYWTFALFLLMHELLNQAVVSPGYPIDVAVGYLDPQGEADAFGLAVSVGPEDVPFSVLPPEPTPIYSLPAVREGFVEIPRLEGWPDDFGPVVVRRPRAFVEMHAPPPGFAGATSASYVRSRSTGSPLGLLGCRHVLPLPQVGAGVPMVGFPAQKVTALSDQLDLAVVSSPTPVPAKPRAIHRWPAQWLPCEIAGSTGTVKTRVAEVSNTWGVFSDPLLPVHIDLEHPAQHGDSGAAVLDASSSTSGGVMGVYVGAIQNQGPTRARAVHIQQVEAVMDLELVE